MEKGIAEFLRLFGAEATEIYRDATKRTVTATRKSSKAVLANAPVDTGEFVSNFEVAIGHWPSDAPRSDDPAKETTRQRLEQVIDGAEYGQALLFENDDPVSVRLEFGYSKKAPQGVIRLAARQWRRQVRNAGIAAFNKISKGQKKVID